MPPKGGHNGLVDRGRLDQMVVFQHHDPTTPGQRQLIHKRRQHHPERRPDRQRRGEPRLPDCDLYVTLEPCPMCAAAIAFARIRRLYFGAYDPKAGAIASLFDVVRDPRLNHRPEVVGGFEADRSPALLDVFFASHR